MKKAIALFLAILTLVMLFGCFGATEHDKKTIVADSKGDSGKDGHDSGDAVEEGIPTIDEQVCFENMGIKVTAKSIENDLIFGTGIKLLIENNGSRAYSIGVDDVIVNDCMISTLFSSQVAAGKKANDTLYLSSSDLKAAGIGNIGKIEIYFYIYDTDSYETVYRADCVTIKTSLFDKADTTPDVSGTELYNADGIRIVGKYVDEDSFWGTSVLLCIENKTKNNVTVSCDEMSVNGFMVTPLFSAHVRSGKYTVDDITVMSSDLEENGITSVEDIELKFRIYDSDSYKTVAEPKPVSFKVK